jgi:protein-disulfide isomerase
MNRRPDPQTASRVQTRAREQARIGSARWAALCTILSLVLAGCAGGTPSARAPGHAANVTLPATQNTPLATAGELGPSEPSNQPSSPQIPVEPDDAVWGSPTAPITVVAFLDFQCPFCGRSWPTLEQLEREYGPAKLRVVFKHNPLPFHQDALPAAVAAQSVFELAGPNAFFAYAEQLFQNQQSLDDATLIRLARSVGVGRDALLQQVRSTKPISKVRDDMQLAAKIGAEGTPDFRINGVEISGAQPIDAFRSVIDGELKQVAALEDKGVPASEVYGQRVAANFTAPKPPERESPPPEDTTVHKVPIGNSPVLGPATAPVTIVEFADFQCPFCKRAEPTLKELMKRYAGKIRLVFKQSPLPFHPRAMPAAMLALEARAERGDHGFWQVHDLLYDSQPHLDDSDLLAIAKQASLNVARVKAAIAHNSHMKEVQADQDLADAVGARGTPTFFINGRKLVGAEPIDVFTTLIDAQLEKAKTLTRDRGVPSSRVYVEIMKTAEGPPPPETKSVPAPTRQNPSRGPARAPVVIQMFSDFQCPYCKRSLPTIAKLEKAFPGKIRLVWRNLPLSFHAHARLAANAAMEAFAERGAAGFWRMHKLIYDGQEDPGLSRAVLEGYAKKMGLDLKRFDKALDTSSHDAEIDKDIAVAKSAGIDGTPGFVINGYYVAGAQPLSKFRRVVELALHDLRKHKKRN